MRRLMLSCASILSNDRIEKGNNQEIKYAFIFENILIVWKDGSQTKIGTLERNKELLIDDLFISLKNIRNITLEEIKVITGLEVQDYNRIIQENNFQDLFFSAERDIEKYFVINEERVCGIYNQDRQRQFDESICEYCGTKFNTGAVNLWTLLANIFYRNLTIVTEFRPSIQHRLNLIQYSGSRIYQLLKLMLSRSKEERNSKQKNYAMLN